MTGWRKLTALVSLVMMAGLLWIAAHAFGAAQEQTVKYRFIADALQPAPERNALVSWEAATEPLDRPFNAADEESLGQALGEAWHLLAVAQGTGDDVVLTDRWTGPALERARLSVRDATDFGGRMSVLTQKAKPVFYHKDGSLFQAEVEMIVSRYMAEGDEPEGFSLLRETGVATFLNEANGWRLFSYERRTADALTGEGVSWSGSANGLNYYPAATPWHDFWPAFDAAIVGRDFEQMRALGVDTIRFFLPREPFLDRSSSAAALADLQSFLDLAQSRGIKVIPTLFDLRGGYKTSGWALDALYLQKVLPVLSASPAVAFIDLKNEPDLDFEAHGRADVLAWLRTMLGLIRTEAPGLATTIGWSAPEHAGLLAEDIDVITYHDYGPVEATRERLRDVTSIAGGKPVIITEIGASTYGFVFGMPGSEMHQAENLGRRMEALAESDGVLIWTLHDFPFVDPRVVGPSPWVQRLQSSFGLMRPDGTEKPAAAVVRENFMRAVDQPKG